MKMDVLAVLIALLLVTGEGMLIIWLRLTLDRADERIKKLEKELACAKSDALPRATSARQIGW